jgi:hypothetical protein
METSFPSFSSRESRQRTGNKEKNESLNSLQNKRSTWTVKTKNQFRGKRESCLSLIHLRRKEQENLFVQQSEDKRD